MKFPEMAPKDIFLFTASLLHDDSEFAPTHVLTNEHGTEKTVELRKIVRHQGGDHDGRLSCIYRFRVGNAFGAGMWPKDEFDQRSRQIQEPVLDNRVVIAVVDGQAEIVF